MRFWKMSGAGNDFVLLTGGRRDALELKRLASALCARKASVGADGLLYVNRSGPGRVDVRYFNSDGSEAFCGNGSRCAAWWAFSSGLAGRKLLLRTLAGELGAEITVPGAVRMRMPDVSGARIGVRGRFPGGVRTLHFLDTGVPHAVVPVRSVADVDVERLGRQLRRHRFFGPAGTNVNFVERRGRRLLVRTYERGVEGETLACGTGLTASAVAFALSDGLRSPVRLVSRSGDGFTVALSARAGGACAISIEGPARTVFQGEIKC